MIKISLHGDLGADQVDVLRRNLQSSLNQPRPQLQLDLCGVTSLHLGVINVLVAARDHARTQLGDLFVIVGEDTAAQHMLAQVGIVASVRP